jgi:UDP-N-acetylglucosamine 2-epimerase (non-hydrolysing)
MPKKIHLIAGARPNFMKIAPLIRAFRARSENLSFKLIHTGQHYDREMSDVFFEELGIPTPDFHLNAGGGSHAEQTAQIMLKYEKVVLEDTPDCVLVVGDVNSTLACSIVAKKMQIPVAHVEAGLRSGDIRMPEEVNRLVTDAISDWLFVTEPAGVENLKLEGKGPAKVFFVGHVMVDNLLFQAQKLKDNPIKAGAASDLKKRLGRYGVVTLHRPSNVDDMAVLTDLLSALTHIAKELPLVFPVHPRTRQRLEQMPEGLPAGIHLLPPQAYMEFLDLWQDAALVLTDSGGLQEETTALGVPCLTLRENTERPITIDQGTNVLVGTDPAKIIAAASEALTQVRKSLNRPEKWDGQAALRIAEILESKLMGVS